MASDYIYSGAVTWQGSTRKETMATQIKFGTSGWRAIVADEFTVENIRRAVTGIAKYVAAQPLKNDDTAHRILVGRDPRFLGESFVGEAAAVLAAHGIVPEVIPEPAPTPAIAYGVRERKTSGAINFTASHNPPEYNGIKFSTPDGAPALPEVTKQIEAEIAALGEGPIIVGAPRAEQYAAEVKPDYMKRLAELVDLAIIKASGIKVVVDPFWGAGRGYQSELLAEAGIAVSTALADAGRGRGAGRGADGVALVHSKLRNISQGDSVPQLSGSGSLLWQQSGFLALGPSRLSPFGQ